MRPFNAYEAINLIRSHPGLYIGSKSLVAMWSFLVGCLYIVQEYGIECSGDLTLHGFHNWVAHRYGWKESTTGWCNIILQECGGDDGKAFDRFFELFEEYRNSVKSVATTDGE